MGALNAPPKLVPHLFGWDKYKAAAVPRRLFLYSKVAKPGEIVGETFWNFHPGELECCRGGGVTVSRW